MKKILFSALLIPMLAVAQDASQNYIRTTMYKEPTTTSIASPNLSQAAQSTLYYDGLGRPIQQVAGKQSSDGKDIVTLIEYDAFGRQVKEYMPYPSSNTALEFTSPSTALQATVAHYQSAYGDANPFSEKFFESSPLDRVTKQAAPGNDWGMGNGHEVRTDYLVNSTTDAVKLYNATANAPSGGYYPVLLTQQGTYAAGQLYKTVTKDENWVSGKGHTTEEFKNKEGQVVLKRTYDMVPNRGGPIPKAHDTYYVYDQFGNLSIVMPPLSNGSGSSSDLNGLCYQYRYDYRNRLVEKKLPGKEWEFIVYDKLDRPIASGPSYSPFGNGTMGWLITKYDAFGRVAYTGWFNGQQPTSGGRELLQQYANTATVLFESRTASNTIDNIVVGYTNTVYPTSGYVLLSASYYDNYTFPNAEPVPSAVLGIPVLASAKGLATGSWTRVLTSETEYLGNQSVVFYDSKSRPIRNYEKNYLGGNTHTDTRIDFSGKTLYTVTEHKREGSDTPTRIREDFTYTAQDRLLTHTHQINGGAVELLSKKEYDPLGQLIRKSVGGSDVSGAGALQKVDYRYNIRGWLTGINTGNPIPAPAEPADLFVFELKYNNPESAMPLFNGNISETHWKSASDMVRRKYEYGYDALNRFRQAVYFKADQNYQATEAYNEGLQYDKNGNITQLWRNGNNDGTMGLEIDFLTYSYHPQYPNRLMKVTDDSLDPNGFKDGTNSGDDYTYDDYGNMTSDANKNILSISYNHLNLPVKVAFNIGNDKIEYLYDANGKKMRKSTPFASTTAQGGIGATQVDYLDGFQYQDGILKFFPTAEGYVLKTRNVYSYVYNYTDHLGNVRLSYAFDQVLGTVKILEENHYYPFGLKHTNYNTDILAAQEKSNLITFKAMAAPVSPVPQIVYNYKYNGKEFQDERGLNTYDYGFRQYMPDIGRFGNIDMLAELAYDLTPNRYCFNNPIRFTDPTGLWEETADGYKANKEEDIKRFMLYMNVEKYALNNSPTNAQISSFIDGEMSSGGHGKTSDGSILADEVEVTSHKQVGGGFRLIASEESFNNFWHGVQRSLTPDALDPRTLGQQFLGIGGLTYPGPSNPKTYSGNDDYTYAPRRIEELPAIAHDLAYDKLNVRGGGGLFTAKSAIGADYRFVAQELTISIISTNIRTKYTAGALGVGLGLAALPKTVYSTVMDTYAKVHASTKD